MDKQSANPPITPTVQKNRNTSLNRKGNENRTIICKRREYRHLINDPKTKLAWNTSAANEFGCLMNGLKRGISVTGTMKQIHKYEVPTGQTVTYARFVCDYIPQK